MGAADNLAGGVDEEQTAASTTHENPLGTCLIAAQLRPLRRYCPIVQPSKARPGLRHAAGAAGGFGAGQWQARGGGRPSNAGAAAQQMLILGTSHCANSSRKKRHDASGLNVERISLKRSGNRRLEP